MSQNKREEHVAVSTESQSEARRTREQRRNELMAGGMSRRDAIREVAGWGEIFADKEAAARRRKAQSSKLAAAPHIFHGAASMGDFFSKHRARYQEIFGRPAAVTHRGQVVSWDEEDPDGASPAQADAIPRYASTSDSVWYLQWLMHWGCQGWQNFRALTMSDYDSERLTRRPGWMIPSHFGELSFWRAGITEITKEWRKKTTQHWDDFLKSVQIGLTKTKAEHELVNALVKERESIQAEMEVMEDIQEAVVRLKGPLEQVLPDALHRYATLKGFISYYKEAVRYLTRLGSLIAGLYPLTQFAARQLLQPYDVVAESETTGLSKERVLSAHLAAEPRACRTLVLAALQDIKQMRDCCESTLKEVEACVNHPDMAAMFDAAAAEYQAHGHYSLPANAGEIFRRWRQQVIDVVCVPESAQVAANNGPRLLSPNSPSKRMAQPPLRTVDASSAAPSTPPRHTAAPQTTPPVTSSHKSISQDARTPGRTPLTSPHADLRPYMATAEAPACTTADEAGDAVSSADSSRHVALGSPSQRPPRVGAFTPSPLQPPREHPSSRVPGDIGSVACVLVFD